MTIAADSDGHQWTCVDQQPQVVTGKRKHERFRNFPDKEAVERHGFWPRRGLVQQGSTATGTETSRLRRTSMDGQQVLEHEFSNVASMCLQDGMQKVGVRVSLAPPESP